MDEISLGRLSNAGGVLLEELEKGKMAIVRSKNDFLYIVEFDGQFHMFSHTPGAPGGGQKQFVKDEKHIAIITKLTELADHVYSVEFDKSMNLYGVMATAEEGILHLYPGDDRDSDSDIEFHIPDGDRQKETDTDNKDRAK